MKFQNDDSLMKALREDVDAYFTENSLDTRDQPAMWAKAAFMIVWFYVSYGLLVFGGFSALGSILAAVSLGLATAGIGFNVMHDGGHGSFSKSARANRWLFRSLDMVGASSYVWKHKHNSAHHSYTNIAGQDDDLEIGGLIRMSPEQPYLPVHRFQHIYSWILYGLLVPKWVVYDDYAVLMQGKIGETKIRPPKGVELAVFVGGKMFSYTMAFVIPLILFPVWQVIVFYLLVNAVIGVTLATVFQLAHVVEGTEFPHIEGEQINNTFSRHQLATTANFAPRNRLVTWYVGGLNFQIEHHLFPRISHAHYPAIAELVKRRAQAEGAPHLTYDTLTAAIVSHYQHLRTLATPTPR